MVLLYTQIMYAMLKIIQLCHGHGPHIISFRDMKNIVMLFLVSYSFGIKIMPKQTS